MNVLESESPRGIQHSDLLPGLVMPEEFEMLSTWFFEQDFEAIDAEIDRLRESQYGPQVRQIWGSTSPIEDYVVGGYHPIAEAPVRQEKYSDRRIFINDIWVPEETTHGIMQGLLIDRYDQNAVSSRSLRNEQALARVSSFKLLGDKALVQAGLWVPETMGTIVAAKGMANEVQPRLVYLALSLFFTSQDMPHLAGVFKQMSGEEGKHWKQYLEDVRTRLEEHPHLQKPVRFIMEHNVKVVGNELVLLDDIKVMLGLIEHYMEDKRVARIAALSDREFGQLPGMHGVEPLVASTAYYNRQFAAAA